MNPRLYLPISGIVLGTIGCGQDLVTAPVDLHQPPARSEISTPRVSVMTQNVYVGADVDAVITALVSPDPSDDLPTLLSAVATLQETDFPARAGAIASQIARTRPHIVGLQEMSQIDIDLTPLGLPVVYHIDFFAALRRALADRGLRYELVVKVKNIDAAPLPGVRLVDYDAMLVDTRRVTVGSDREARNYSANLGTVAPGVVLVRGWVSISATIEGVQYRLASTHLESGTAPGFDLLRAAQIGELVTSLADAPRAIIVGDLNDFEGSPMYQVAIGAGYTDVWGTLNVEPDGNTCCHDINLANPRAEFTQRIDFVLARGFGREERAVTGNIARVGYRPGEKVPGPIHPLWSSDHAGLVATLIAPPASLAAR